HHGIDLVRLQRLPRRRPRGVDAGIQQGLLDGDQQMVGQHAEKNVRLHAPFFVVKDRPLSQWRLQRPKGRFGPRQQCVDPPSLIRAQIRTVGLQQVTPIELFRACPLGLIQAVAEHLRLAVVLHAVIPRDARIALLQPAGCLCLCPWPPVFVASPSPPAVVSRALRESPGLFPCVHCSGIIREFPCPPGASSLEWWICAETDWSAKFPASPRRSPRRSRTLPPNRCARRNARPRGSVTSWPRSASHCLLRSYRGPPPRFARAVDRCVCPAPPASAPGWRSHGGSPPRPRAPAESRRGSRPAQSGPAYNPGVGRASSRAWPWGWPVHGLQSKWRSRRRETRFGPDQTEFARARPGRLRWRLAGYATDPGCGRVHLRPGVGNRPAKYPARRWSESNRAWPIRWPGESAG